MKPSSEAVSPLRQRMTEDIRRRKQGKGRKDRYAMLSPVLLERLPEHRCRRVRAHCQAGRCVAPARLRRRIAIAAVPSTTAATCAAVSSPEAYQTPALTSA